MAMALPNLQLFSKDIPSDLARNVVNREAVLWASTGFDETPNAAAEISQLVVLPWQAVLLESTRGETARTNLPSKVRSYRAMARAHTKLPAAHMNWTVNNKAAVQSHRFCPRHRCTHLTSHGVPPEAKTSMSPILLRAEKERGNKSTT